MRKDILKQGYVDHCGNYHDNFKVLCANWLFDEKKAKELLNDGLDPIDIVTNNRTRYCDLDGFVYDSLSDMCNALGIDKKEVMRRMSFGYGIRDILLELVFDKKYI